MALKRRMAEDRSIWICPGFADRAATDRFLAALWQRDWPEPIVLEQAYYHPDRLLRSLQAHQPTEPIVLIGFSAGVAATVGAALAWQATGGRVRALFAVDGWGVVLPPSLPIYRLSHDRWSNRTGAWLGAGREQFWADPPVDHVALWRSPDRAWGWWAAAGRAPVYTTAAEVLRCHLTVCLADGHLAATQPEPSSASRLL